MDVTDDVLVLLSHFIHSGYYSTSIRFMETTLRGTELTDACVSSLVSVLQTGVFPDLAVLDLQNCRLSDASVRALCDCLYLHKEPLDVLLSGRSAARLSFVGNPISKPDTWFAVARLLFRGGRGRAE